MITDTELQGKLPHLVELLRKSFTYCKPQDGQVYHHWQVLLIWTLFGRTLGWQSSRKRPTSSLHSRATASWSFIPEVVCRNVQYDSGSLSTHFSILSTFPSLTSDPLHYRKLSSYSLWIYDLSWLFLHYQSRSWRIRPTKQKNTDYQLIDSGCTIIVYLSTALISGQWLYSTSQWLSNALSRTNAYSLYVEV